jgi:hypothetical protein
MRVEVADSSLGHHPASTYESQVVTEILRTSRIEVVSATPREAIPTLLR